MGIKHLIQLIKKYSPTSIKITNIADYRNKRLGIDFNLIL